METYLTIKEAAELKGCSTQYLQKVALNGTIQAKKTVNEKNRPQYMIPLSALETEIQMKYRKAHGISLPEPEKAKSPEKPTKTVEELNERQREQVSLWIRIIEDWQEYRSQYGGSRAEADTAFIAYASRKYPDVKITADILRRRHKLLKSGDKAALADSRGYTRKGASSIPQAAWDAFLYYYLDEVQHPAKKCYEYMIMWARDEQPQLLTVMPTYSTFCRHLESDIEEALKTLGRQGEKAFTDRYAPYIRRVYDNMRSNEWWIGDNHTFDIMTLGENGKPHRLYLTAFMDARSGMITGFYVTDNPSSQATVYALRRGIVEYGIPENLYLDNGREFLTRDVGGLGHRQKKSTRDEFAPPNILQRLGIKMTNAIVRNARAKIIERRFLDVKNGFSRLFRTFTGGNVTEKPEQLKSVLKSGNIMTDEEFIAIAETIINNYLNMQVYNGSVAKDKGKTRRQVYEDNLLTKRTAEESELNLMLMRSSRLQTVGRRGVHLKISGRQIDYFNSDLLHLQGKQVYFRYDPDDLGSVRIYDTEDRYLMTVPADVDAICEYGASQEDVKAAIHKVKGYQRDIKNALKAQKTMILGEHTALDLVLMEAEHNKQIKITASNPVLDIQRANEAPLAEAVGGSTGSTVDIDRMIMSAEARKKRKDE